MTDQTPGMPLWRVAPNEPIVAEVLVGRRSIEDVVGGDQDRVGDGDGGHRGATPAMQPRVRGVLAGTESGSIVVPQ